MYIIVKSKHKGSRPLRVAVAQDYGNVGVILTGLDHHDFPETAATLSLSASEARAVAAQLIKAANETEGK